MSGELSAREVGKGIAEHAKLSGEHQASRDRALSILEAVLLSVVALLAAWSGYSAAKWSTESRVNLARASTERANANRADLEALELRNSDSSAFEAWFAAFVAGDERAMALATRRFRPVYREAFDAWRATRPETNPNAPRGPAFMPQYRQPDLARAKALGNQATASFVAGVSAGATADKYVRSTVFLATVLFIVGISSHFPLRSARYGLIGLAGVLLVIAVVQLSQLPRPPS